MRTQPFGLVPPNVPVERSLDVLAPVFRQRLLAMLDALKGGGQEWVFETLRTERRQEYLYGFGRLYDDGRGQVTRAKTALFSWHAYGMAVDIIDKDLLWKPPPIFWSDLGRQADLHRLTWGGRFSTADLPHVQSGNVPATPTDADRQLFREQGVRAVWAKYNETEAFLEAA